MTSLYKQLLKGSVDFALLQILVKTHKGQKPTTNYTGIVWPSLLFYLDNHCAKGVFLLK